MAAPLSWRNNNPGNLRGEYFGASGSNGGFATYPSMDAGWNAMEQQLDRYRAGKTTGRELRTVNDIIGTWAPTSENDTGAYARRVASDLGVGVDDPLPWTPEVKSRLMTSMATHEAGKLTRHGATPPSAGGARPRSTAQAPPSTQSSPPQATAMNPSFMPPPGREEPWGAIEPKMGPQSLTDRMGTNPWLQMGLGILADNNIGSGAQRGLLAASQTEKLQGDRRQQAIVNEQRRRDDENYRQQNQMNRYRMAGGGAETAAARSQREGKTYRMWDDKGNFHMVYRGPNGEFMDAVTQTPIPPEVGRTLKTDSMLGGASGASGGADGMTAEEKKRNKQQSSVDELASLHSLIGESYWNAGPAGVAKHAVGRVGAWLGSEAAGEMAAEIAAIQGRASAATSGIAKEIVNEGDNRMSDADRRAAADIAKINSWTSQAEALQGIETVMGLKHRRMLIDQGIPPEQIYDPTTKMPTVLGTPPQFRMTGGQGALQTPSQSAGMSAMPPQAGGAIDPRQARIDELEREKQSYLQQGMGPQGMDRGAMQ